MRSKNDWLDYLEHSMLCHYGVVGMHWGIRRYQPYSTVPRKSGKGGKELGSLQKDDAARNAYKKAMLKNSYNKNFEKWGKSKDTNILYITGRSGSGKSTVADKIADKNTRVVHLDLYFDNSNGAKGRDRDLDRYMSKHLPEYKMLGAPMDKISLNSWGKICEKFEVELENYGQYQYKNGNKVIVEGVELLDDTIRPDKSFFQSKPVVILKTNPLTSSVRAMKRDQVRLEKNEIVNTFENHREWTSDIRKFKSSIKGDAHGRQ